MRLGFYLSAAGLLLLLVTGVRFYSQRSLGRLVTEANQREASLPARVLWVWERAEDLQGVNPESTAVAVLEETLRLGTAVGPVFRHQAVILPDRAQRIAVVRIETGPGFAAHKNDEAVLEQSLVELKRISEQRGIAALQIDFDAKKSERGFYRRLLTGLREQMPETLFWK